MRHLASDDESLPIIILFCDMSWQVNILEKTFIGDINVKLILQNIFTLFNIFVECRVQSHSINTF